MADADYIHEKAEIEWEVEVDATAASTMASR